MTITTVKKLYRTCDKMRVQLDELEEVMGLGAQAATHYTDTLAFEVMEIIDRLRMSRLIHDSTKVDIVSEEDHEFWFTMVLDAEIDRWTESKLKQEFTIEDDGKTQLISVFVKLN